MIIEQIKRPIEAHSNGEGKEKGSASSLLGAI